MRRAPWFKGVNPCGEILLGDKSFCNLVEVVLPRFNGDEAGLQAAVRLAARANYRQTCVNLRDGVLTLQGERPLVAGISDRLYSKRVTADATEYLHHFLDEENKHMVMFGMFLNRYVGKVYPEKKIALDSLFLKPVPVTRDNLDTVLSAGWIKKAALCQGVAADGPAACK